MDPEEEREQKQTYLRVNILEKGYDTVKFITFLQEQRGIFFRIYLLKDEGDNVDNWKLDELESIVLKFTSQNAPSENSQEEPKAENPESSIQQKVEVNPPVVENLHKSESSDENEKDKQIPENEINEKVENKFNINFAQAESTGPILEIKKEEILELNDKKDEEIKNHEEIHKIENVKEMPESDKIEEKQIKNEEIHENVKIEPENAKIEEKPVKIEEPSKVETVQEKIEEKKQETLQSEKIVEPKTEEKKIEIPKIEEKKLEIPKIEEKKIEIPKIEEKKPEPQKIDTKKSEMPKIEEKKIETKKPEIPLITDKKPEQKPAIIQNPQVSAILKPENKIIEQHKKESVKPIESKPIQKPITPLFSKEDLEKSRKTTMQKQPPKIQPPIKKPEPIQTSVLKPVEPIHPISKPVEPTIMKTAIQPVQVPQSVTDPKLAKKEEDKQISVIPQPVQSEETKIKTEAQAKEKVVKPLIIPVIPKVIITKEITENEFKDKKIKIKVTEPTIKVGGLFSSTVVSFGIETAPFKWKVLRRYKDVLNLREILRKQFPASVLPPLDPEYEKDREEPKWISEAMPRLQRFFFELQRDPLIRASEPVYYFLSLTERVQYEARFKYYLKAEQPWQKISEIKHVGGKARCDIPSETVKLSNIWLAYVPEAKSLYERMQKAMSDTEKVTAMLGEVMRNNAQIFKEFAIMHSKVEHTEMSDVFNSLKTLSSYLSELYKKQANLTKTKFEDFFTYYRDEIESLNEVSQLLENAKKNFLQKEQHLHAKKEKLFSEGKPQDWELPKEILVKHSFEECKKDKFLSFPVMLPKVFYKKNYKKNRKLKKLQKQ